MNRFKQYFSVCCKLITLIHSLRNTMMLAITTGSIGHIIATSIPTIGAYAIAKTLLKQKVSLWMIIVILIILTILRSLLRYVEQLSNHYVAFKTLHIIRDKVFKAIRRLSPAKLDGKDRGELISILTADIELLEVFYAHTISPIAIAIVHTTVLFLFLLQYSVSYALLLFLFHLLMAIVVPIVTSKRAKNIGNRQRKELSNLNSEILDTFMGIKECIQYNNGKQRMFEVNQRTNKLNRSTRKLSRIFGENQGLSIAIILIGNLVMLIVSSMLYHKGVITSVSIIVAMTLFMSSFGPVSALSDLANNLLITFACGERVLNLLEETPEVEEITNGKDIDFEDLEVENLSFSYHDEELLNDISLSLKQGEILGISGKSGSGKSTLLKLIMRFYDTKVGTIQLNNLDIKEINTASLRRNESYVTQSVHLFKDTILENIKIAKQDATMEEIQEACKKASIHEFIKSLEDGYETKLGDRENLLSTGEMQRISVARAFLHESSLMLLDEPTANIDSLNEGIILKSIWDESKEKAILIVSHKKSTLRIADEIIEVVREGQS